MQRTKFLLLTLLLVVGFSIPGCYPELDCDCPPVARYMVVDQINLSLLNDGVEVEAGDTVSWASLTVSPGFEIFFTGQRENRFSPKGGFSLIPSAMACSCLWDGYEGLESSLVDVDWVNRFEYDADHPADGDFRDFMYYDGSKDYIEELDQHIDQEVYEDEMGSFPFTIKQPPVEPIPFQLWTNFTFVGGETVAAESVEIVLVP